MRFSEEQVARYSRHILLKEIGGRGQRRLLEAKVLIVGAGGLGSPAALYLAAAGVGTIGVVDSDRVELSNLQRQILHGTPDLDRPKTEVAQERLKHLNPEVQVIPHPVRLTAQNALKIIQGYDVVLDGSDNFPTRYLVNDACGLLGVPDVFGSVLGFEGQASVFAPRAGGPCYRCVFPAPPPPGTVASCAEAGVVGVLPGLIGTIQAAEALKLILGIGRTLQGRLLLWDALTMSVEEVQVARDEHCPLCGDRPTITELMDYEAFCGQA